MSTPTPEEALYDAWELHWRARDDHVYEISDAASEDLLGRMAAALRDAERRGAEAMKAAAVRAVDGLTDSTGLRLPSQRAAAAIAALPLPGDPVPVDATPPGG